MSSARNTDPFDLQRFVSAQNLVFEEVRVELERGQKVSHWMWFIFPQVRGLGFSSMAQKFAISSAAEAVAYLNHPVLGSRLLECTRLVNAIQGRSLKQIFGSPDDMKFRSSMTLFASVAADKNEFAAALQKYCSGNRDVKTIAILEEVPSDSG
jgi:uncharacterized protein (DUF1810 family)